MRKANHGSKDKNAPSPVKTKNDNRKNGKPRGEKANPVRAPKQDYRVEAIEERVAAVRSSDPALQALEPAERLTFPLVGIGTSAGGLEALESLIKHLRAENMAFVVVQHLSPQHKSALESLLSRYTPLPVVTATDGLKVEPKRIYVIPPGSLLSIQDGALHVDQTDDDRAPRLTIDFFFRSLAKEQGPGAIGVILSGTGTDGTLGIAEIKAGGGITFVQEPSTAMYSGMPQSALDSGYADFTLPPEKIAEELMRISHHPYVASAGPYLPGNDENFAKILALLRHSFNIDFELYKGGTVKRRIERRMALNRIVRMDDYLKHLQQDAPERSTLFRDLLINVTRFFRDAEVYERLKSAIFPQILEGKEKGSTLRLWVPGCSTGEEAYSLAIALAEFFADKGYEHKVQIFASDVDGDAIRFARLGVYPHNIELDVSPARLQRFFLKRDKHYDVSKAIRDLVVFAVHDLIREPPFSRVDLISCRNVLIYMQSGLQKKVLRLFQYSLNPGGFLLLGSAETVGIDSAGTFNLEDGKLKLYRRKNTPVTAVFDLRPANALAEPEDVPALRLETRSPVRVQQLADRKVIERYAPPGVLVNEGMEVLQFRGKTGEYLEPASGGATLSVLKLVRPELVIPLRTTLDQARQTGLQASSGPIRLSNATEKECVVEILPVQESGSLGRCYLILFTGKPVAGAGPKRAPVEKRDGKTKELERELASTKEYLQTVIEEIEAANEELQSSNEELQSSNEELQSTNEELQTSKEELQSTNEELATVNEELQNRMTELTQFKDDLQNIIDSVETPVILVGMDLRVRGLTGSVSPALGIGHQDIGRPIGHLLPKSESSALENLIADVVKSIKEREQGLSGKDGRSYLARVRPYKTADHRIKGAVITLLRP